MRLLLRSVLLFAIISFSSVLYAQVVSDFTSNADGWTIFNTSTGGYVPIGYFGAGGNPGGYITDGGTFSGPTILYAEAPLKFRGNLSSSYRQNLTVDLKTDFVGANNTNGDVIITGTGGSLYYQLPSKPGVSFTSYIVKLDETFAGWHFNGPAAAAPTQTQMKTVLSNITSLRIRTKYTTANTTTATGSLDNVVLNVPLIVPPADITSFTPTSGLPGTTVTITGTNFSTTLAQNVVYFNGVKANITNATASQLTVTSPARIAYGPISVINLANGTQAVSRLNFNPLFDNNQDFGGRVMSSTFAKFMAFGPSPVSGLTFTGFSVGDLDGDGWTDVLTTDNVGASNLVSVFRNLQLAGTVSASSFATPLSLTIPNAPIVGAVQRVGQTSIADMDADGKLDLIINVGYNFGGNDDNSFVIFLNQSTPGTLAFSSGSIFQFLTTQNNNQAMAIADIDGDGRPELLGALINSSSHLGIAQNLSTPGNLDFAQIVDFSLGVTMGSDITVGDLNGDNKPEIITIAYSSASTYAYENTSVPGTISLGTPFQITTLASANVEIADLDNDNKNEIVFKDISGPSVIHIKKNNHSSGPLSLASFSADILLGSSYSTGAGINYTTTADVNGDNRIDIIAGDGTNMFVYQNNYTAGPLSANSFVSGIGFEGSGSSNRYVICADVDGDNKPEVLLRPGLNNAFWVYHNESFPVPSITSITPTSAITGSAISLNGNLLSVGNTSPTVRLNKINSTINGSPTNVLTVVNNPQGSISGRFNLTNHGLTGISSYFNSTFTTNRVINSSSFSPSTDFALAGSSSSLRNALEVADFDDDGKMDAVIIDNFSTGKIFKNSHATAGQSITTASLSEESTTYASTYNVIALDIDGDGKEDLHSGFQLFRNNSSGAISFSTGASTSSSGFNYVARGDFDKDGKMDLAVTDGSAFIQVYQNRSTRGAFTATGNFGTFNSTAVSLAKPNNYGGIVAEDFDNDGYDDLASVNSVANSITIYGNKGVYGPLSVSSFQLITLGTFTPISGTTPYSLTAKDFDGDGKIDLAVTYFNSAFVSVYRNISVPADIQFAAAVNLPCVSKGYDIASQDLDGDGKAEIVVIHQPNPGPGSFSVFQNVSAVGNITFNAVVNYPITRNPQGLNIADINSDQKPDILIVANSGTIGNALMVFENKIPAVTLPTITSFAPTSGPIGTTVTITGTNFSSTPANNIVYFGATRAIVNAATSTQLTVNVPVGATYQPISATINSLTAFSSSPFEVTFANGGVIDACSFAAKVDLTAGVGPNSVSIGDFDGDGKSDLALVNTNSSTVSVFRNTSSGAGSINYAAKIDFATGITPLSVSIGDLDGDGRSDLVTANANSNTVSVFLNTSSGVGSISFASRADFTAGAGSQFVTIGDFDADGKVDLAVANRDVNTVSVIRNTSSGAGNINFAPKIDFTTGATPQSISIGDFDGDGKTDLAVANANTPNTVSVFRNTSSGVGNINYAPKIDFTTGNNPQSVAVGDLDGDGKADLAVANGGSSTVSVFRNTSSGAGSISYAAKVDFTTGVQPTSVSIGDLDGDGKADLATANFGGNTSVFRNTSSGIGSISYAAKVDFTAGVQPTSVSVGDLDGDGKADLAVTDQLGSSLSILRNTVSSLPLFTIASFTPTSGPVGAVVTFTGTNFSAVPLNNTVKFNGLSALVTASSSTTITAVVPAGATTGPISIQIGCITAFSIIPFTVTGGASITITTQPSDAIVCAGLIATFNTLAIGTTNITYQWQFSPDGIVPFTDVVNNANYSGVTTIKLSVNTASSFGAGRYRCRINGDLAPQVISNDAGLLINASPSSPTTTGSSTCSSGSLILTASGGVNGQYRWYSVVTGGTAIAGEVNTTYTTPVLSLTTTYFVAINNGTCESTRTPVIATISIVSKPIITTSNCTAISATLTGPAGFTTYAWSNGASTQQIPVTSAGSYTLTVTDGNGCVSVPSDATVFNSNFCNLPPVISTTQINTVVEGKGIVNLSALISDPDNNLDYTTLKVTQQPTSGATATIDANNQLTIDYAGKAFVGMDKLTIEICDLAGKCTQQILTVDVIGEIVIYSGISPNGDGLNDFWEIKYIDVLADTKNNKVSLFNRWGDAVFEVENYNNKDRAFKGLNKSGNEVSSGTYYYRIEFASGLAARTGYLSVRK